MSGTLTPSGRTIAASQQTTSVTTPDGKTIVFRMPDIADEMMITGLVGHEKAVNGVYMQYAMIASSLESINGTPILPPKTNDDLVAIMRKLSRTDFSALLEGMGDTVKDNTISGETAKN